MKYLNSNINIYNLIEYTCHIINYFIFCPSWFVIQINKIQGFINTKTNRDVMYCVSIRSITTFSISPTLPNSNLQATYTEGNRHLYTLYLQSLQNLNNSNYSNKASYTKPSLLERYQGVAQRHANKHPLCNCKVAKFP